METLALVFIYSKTICKKKNRKRGFVSVHNDYGFFYSVESLNFYVYSSSPIIQMVGI